MLLSSLQYASPLGGYLIFWLGLNLIFILLRKNTRWFQRLISNRYFQISITLVSVTVSFSRHIDGYIRKIAFLNTNQRASNRGATADNIELFNVAGVDRAESQSVVGINNGAALVSNNNDNNNNNYYYSKRVKFLRWWFFVGKVVGLLFMILGITVLLLNVIVVFGKLLSSSSSQEGARVSKRSIEEDTTAASMINSHEQQPLMQTMIPGFNMDGPQIVYYFIALFLNAIFHEFGHALCAVSENVTVNSVGMFVHIIYPGAYVELSTPELKGISHSKQLGIYTAGVFHNFVIGLCGMMMWVTVPSLVSSVLYVKENSGAVVDYVDIHSPLKSYLLPGTVIKDINNKACLIRDSETFHSCVNYMNKLLSDGEVGAKKVDNLNPKGKNNQEKGYKTRGGFCLSSKDDYEEGSKSNGELCCDTKDGHSMEQQQHLIHHSKTIGGPNLCFESSTYNNVNKRSCLNTRQVAMGKWCINNEDCLGSNDDYTCAKPLLKQPNFEFFKITYTEFTSTTTVHSNMDDDYIHSVLFLGQPSMLYHSVSVTDYNVRYRYLPLQLLSATKSLIRYIITVSMALGVMNSVPCYKLDGEFMLKALLRVDDDKNPSSLVNLIVLFCTLLVVINILLSLISLVTQ